MRKSAKSASSPRRSKRKGSALGRHLIAGLNEALAHARGEVELPSYKVVATRATNLARNAGSRRAVRLLD